MNLGIRLPAAERKRRLHVSDSAASPPVVALLVKGSEEGPGARIARALARGFEELGVRYDAVFLEGPRGVRERGLTREVRLGSGRASRSVPAITSYLRWASPALTLVGPSFITPFAIAAGLLTGRSVVPWEPAFLRREVPYLRRRDRLIPLAQRLTYPRAARLAVVSRDVGSELIAAFGGRIPEEKLFVLPNPVDGEEARRLASPVASRNGKLRLCTIGRLAPEKGYDVLLAALRRADSQLGDWELIVIGDGPRRGELERLSAELGVAKAVHFVGHLKNPFSLLASADIFVHSARWEGFGLVLGEALSLGIPIVATNAPGGTREILADGKFGLLVPSEDPDLLAEALVGFASNPSLRARYAEAGPVRAADFSPERIAREILLAVESLVDIS